MFPDNIQTKTVNGCNLCVMDQSRLHLQMLVVRILQKAGFYGLANPFPHFSRSCIGKGHHQKPVNIKGIFSFRYHPDNPFYQHSRLSASGRGAD